EGVSSLRPGFRGRFALQRPETAAAKESWGDLWGFMRFSGGVSISGRFTFSGFFLGEFLTHWLNLPCVSCPVAIYADWILNLFLYGVRGRRAAARHLNALLHLLVATAFVSIGFSGGGSMAISWVPGCLRREFMRFSGGLILRTSPGLSIFAFLPSPHNYQVMNASECEWRESGLAFLFSSYIQFVDGVGGSLWCQRLPRRCPKQDIAIF
ncbi:hypothetical protein TNCV_2564761, partial [Trichonephila clavipes]